MELKHEKFYICKKCFALSVIRSTDHVNEADLKNAKCQQCEGTSLYFLKKYPSTDEESIEIGKLIKQWKGEL